MKPDNEITIRLTPEEAAIYESHIPFKGEELEKYIAVSNKISSLIKTQITSSERSLELQVLQGLWLPDSNELFHFVNKLTGRVSNSLRAGNPSQALLGGEDYFAPSLPLAQKLSEVVRGSHEPTEEDEGITVFTYYPPNGHKETFEYKHDYYSMTNVKIFFTEQQRTNFIASQVKEEPKVKEFKFENKTYSPTGADYDKLNELLAFNRSRGFKG